MHACRERDHAVQHRQRTSRRFRFQFPSPSLTAVASVQKAYHSSSHEVRLAACALRIARCAARRRRIVGAPTSGSSALRLTRASCSALRCAVSRLRCAPSALRFASISRYDADMRDAFPSRLRCSRSPSRSRSPVKREDASPARRGRSASRSRSPPRRRSRSRSDGPDSESMHISSDDAAFVLGKVRDVPTAREAEQAPGVGGAAAARRAAPRRVASQPDQQQQP